MVYSSLRKTRERVLKSDLFDFVGLGCHVTLFIILMHNERNGTAGAQLIGTGAEYLFTRFYFLSVVELFFVGVTVHQHGQSNAVLQSIAGVVMIERDFVCLGSVPEGKVESNGIIAVLIREIFRTFHTYFRRFLG